MPTVEQYLALAYSALSVVLIMVFGKPALVMFIPHAVLLVLAGGRGKHDYKHDLFDRKK